MPHFFRTSAGRLQFPLLVVCLTGCADVKLPDFSEKSTAAPVTEGNSTASESVAPPSSSVTPLPPPVADAPNLVDQATLLLPPQRPGMPRDIVRGQRVWRVIESYQTPTGVTARFAVVSFADEDALSLKVNALLDAGRMAHPMSLAVHNQQALTANPIPLELPLRTPQTFTVLWTHSHSKVIGDVQQVAFTLPDDDTPLVFRSLPASLPPAEPLSADDAAQSLQLLRACCSSGSPGTVFWRKNALTGIAAAELTGWDEDLPVEGAFFIPGNPDSRKPFRLELARDENTGEVRGSLETVKGAGVRGRPTKEPSTTNLLLKDSYVRFEVQLYGHELYGVESSTPVLSLSIAPLPPSPSIMLE